MTGSTLLPDLFLREAARVPHEVALVDGDQRLTYAALRERGLSVARALAGRGIGPGGTVALLFEPSTDAVVAIWGCLLAGATYVPLDPRWPAARIADVGRATSPAVVLSGETVRCALGEVPCLSLDELLAGGGAVVPLRRPPSDLAPAFLLFTSGSTGSPKGVVLPHRGLVAAALFWQEAFALKRDVTCHCQVSSFAFAVFQADVIRAHGSGGRLVVTRPEIALSASRLTEVLRRERVRFVEFVPALLRNLLDHLEETGTRLPELRMVVTGSDRWYVREHRRLRRVLGPSVRCLQSFGASETSIDTARYEDDPVDLEPHELTPIGRPFNGVTVHLVDERLQPVEPGQPGEMLIGGSGVTLGYHDDPRRTAASYLPDPWSNVPGSRLFRTGDLARQLPTGDLQFIGRRDRQAKVRGNRVEPAEIEAVLARHPAVHRVVADVRGEGDDAHVAAWIVFAAGGRPPSAELGDFARRHLPAYMVPSRFVPLHALPLTATGKIDTRALSLPTDDVGPEEPAAAAVRSPLEAMVAQAWTEVMHRPPVDGDADFWEMGGDSLKAARIVARLEARLGIELPLKLVLEHRTPRAMADALHARTLDTGSVTLFGPPPAGRPRQLPASHVQARLWVLDRLHPGETTYVVGTARALPGKPDFRAAERAWARLVSRHESLRITFSSADGRPVQVVHPAGSAARLTRATSARDELLAQLVAQPMNLERGPLVRAAWWECAGEHGVAAALHHTVVDGWSLDVLHRELERLYVEETGGAAADLSPLPMQYADLALWAEQRLGAGRLARGLSRWKELFAGIDPWVELPYDAAAARRTRRGSVHVTPLDPEMLSRLDALSAAQGTTRFVGFLSALGILLRRFCRAEAFPVGTIVANRRLPGSENVIGSFANTLLLPVRCPGGEPARALVARLAPLAAEALDWQDLPLDRVVDAILRPRDPGLSFPQVVLTIEDAGDDPLPPPGLRPGTERLMFDLSFRIVTGAGGETALVCSASEAFEPASLVRVASCYERLLRGLVDDLDADYDHMPLVDDAELTERLVVWNGVAAATNDTVVDRIATAIRQYPDRVAIEDEQGTMTYAELDRAAALLASRLLAAGAGPELPVGLLMQRRVGLITAMLAIIRTGSYYVPLSPDYPSARLALLIADTGTRLLVTDSAHADRAAGCGVPFLRADVEPPLTGEVAALPRIHARQALAAIYTSGSTGRPKGAIIEHRATAALADWSPAVLRDEDLQGVLAVSSICFDLSLLEVFVTLMRGGRILLHENALEVGRSRTAGRGRFMATFPSIVTELLELGAVPGSLRTLNLGGEPFSRALVERAYRETQVARIFNMYGPTEHTVYSSYHLLPPGEPGPPRIGRPVGNARLYVLDAHRNPVPVGVVGELYLGGLGVARGYLGRPAQTAASFVPDPFAGAPGARMYRSGDLVRHRNDGNLEFVARADTQVKVNGYRVELGEIEAVLVAVPGIVEAVAVVREDRPGDKRIVAYVVADDPGVDLDDLRARCMKALPRYMVPTSCVRLDRLIRHPNGKVDRKHLPAPVRASAELSGAVRPRTPTETALVELYAELLESGPVGVDDDFFDLGGNSLLAARLLARLRARLGADLDLATVFEHRTPRELAARVEAAPAVAREAVARLEGDGPVRLSFAQEELWWQQRHEPDSRANHLDLWLRVPPELTDADLDGVVRELSQRHASLRTRFVEAGGQPAQLLGAPADVNPPRLRVDTPANRAAADELCQRPFDLANGPAARANVLVGGQGEPRLLRYTLHRIIADDQSRRLLAEDFARLCRARLACEATPAPATSLRYIDFAAWQRARAEGGALDASIEAWRKLLGSPPRRDPPANRPSDAGQRLQRRLSRELVEGVVRLARNERVAPLDVLFTAFAAANARATGTSDVLVGMPLAGRDQLETELVIGCFENVVPLRLDCSGDPTLLELLGRARAMTLAAQAHAEVPSGCIAAAVGAGEGPRPRALPVEAVLAWHDRTEAGVTAAAAAPGGPPEPCAVRFDLAVTVSAVGGEHPTCTWTFRTTRYDRQHVERQHSLVAGMLRAIVDNPDRRLSRADLGPPAAGPQSSLVQTTTSGTEQR